MKEKARVAFGDRSSRTLLVAQRSNSADLPGSEDTHATSVTKTEEPIKLQSAGRCGDMHMQCQHGGGMSGGMRREFKDSLGYRTNLRWVRLTYIRRLVFKTNNK